MNDSDWKTQNDKLNALIAELTEILKEDRGRYPDGSGRAKELDNLLARSRAALGETK